MRWGQAAVGAAAQLRSAAVGRSSTGVPWPVPGVGAPAGEAGAPPTTRERGADGGPWRSGGDHARVPRADGADWAHRAAGRPAAAAAGVPDAAPARASAGGPPEPGRPAAGGGRWCQAEGDPEPSIPALFADLYELTMAYGYLKTGRAATPAVFDLVFRRAPFGNGWVLAAGLEQAVRHALGLRFTRADVAFVRSTGLFPDEGFYAALADFRFTGDIDAMPEGSVAFPREPLLRVRAPLWQAQLLETALLNVVGHQTLIATKANRVVRAAAGKPVLEFGARRAHGPEAAVLGARAAVIGGCVGTSDVLAGRRYGIPLSGTLAHSWVQSFPDELEAFRAYAAVFPRQLVLLLDTYDTLSSGLEHAIAVFREVCARGPRPELLGVRIDSGDLAALSREARRRLDEAGFPDAKVIASNDLDEGVIRELEAQGAAIDAYGVGTRLITAYDQPALGCVYKLAAVWADDGGWTPRLKVSQNAEKVTDPGPKRAVRYVGEDGVAVADLVLLADEELPPQPFDVFDPVHTWRRTPVARAQARELLLPVVRGGALVAELPELPQIAEHARRSIAELPAPCTRLLNPHAYPVGLSERLWRLRADLLEAHGHR